MQRTDIASITFNLTLPPEIIKEYFDGLTRVEAAKKATSDSNLTSLLSTFGPAVVASCSTKSPVSKEEKKEDPVEKKDDGGMAKVVTNLFDAYQSYTKGETTLDESIQKFNESVNPEEKKEEIKVVSTGDCYQDLKTLIKDNKDIATLFGKIKQDRDMMKLMEIFNSIDQADQQDQQNEKEVKDETNPEIKSPLVRDGNKIVIDPDNIQNKFNGQGLGDMIKSFQGMMRNVNQAMNQPVRENKETKQTKPKKKETTVTAMDILKGVEENDTVD